VIFEKVSCAAAAALRRDVAATFSVSAGDRAANRGRDRSTRSDVRRLRSFLRGYFGSRYGGLSELLLAHFTEQERGRPPQNFSEVPVRNLMAH